MTKMMSTRELLYVLLMVCSSSAATDNVSPPIRKRTQQNRHSSSKSSSHLRGGSTTRDTDNFDPYIGVPRDLSSRSMSLSMPTTYTPTPAPNTALVFIDENDETVPAMTFEPESYSPTTLPASPQPTFMTTTVFDEGFLVGAGVYLGGGEMEEPVTTVPSIIRYEETNMPVTSSPTDMPVTSSPTMSPVTPRPTLVPTSVYST